MNALGLKTVQMQWQLQKTLGIPYQSIDLSKDYKERIVDYIFAEYQKGELQILTFYVIAK